MFKVVNLTGFGLAMPVPLFENFHNYLNHNTFEITYHHRIHDIL